jgi:hypothetical protein
VVPESPAPATSTTAGPGAAGFTDLDDRTTTPLTGGGEEEPPGPDPDRVGCGNCDMASELPVRSLMAR